MPGQVQMTQAEATYGYWDWAFLPENAAEVTGWGFWLGIAGLLLTLVGFGLTFWQLMKTKSATKAATEEVKRIRSSLQAYDAAQEASRAQYALKTAGRYIAKDMWDEVLVSYDDVRKSLLIIRGASPPEISHCNLDIDTAIKFIQRLCERIEASQSIDKAKTLSVLRQHDKLLIDLNITLQRSVI